VIRFACALALLSGPALAQDLNYSDAATQMCLEDAEDFSDRLTCAGASAGECMEETPGGDSTAGMVGCLDRELAFWDDQLNYFYGEAMTAAKQLDTDRPSDMQNQLGSAAALREMQRAWIPFRDKSCAYEASLWGGGTGQGPAALSCLLDQTARQALTLSPPENG
jgi:uncharacterized protein YecT (DUF1311 family)